MHWTAVRVRITSQTVVGTAGAPYSELPAASTEGTNARFGRTLAEPRPDVYRARTALVAIFVTLGMARSRTSREYLLEERRDMTP